MCIAILRCKIALCEIDSISAAMVIVCWHLVVFLCTLQFPEAARPQITLREPRTTPGETWSVAENMNYEQVEQELFEFLRERSIQDEALSSKSMKPRPKSPPGRIPKKKQKRKKNKKRRSFLQWEYIQDQAYSSSSMFQQKSNKVKPTHDKIAQQTHREKALEALQRKGEEDHPSSHPELLLLASLSAKCQIGRLWAKLRDECLKAKPENVWVRVKGMPKVLARNPFQKLLPAKTCEQSAADVFLYGQELVMALKVPDKKVWAKQVSKEQLPFVQSLWFLRNWLVPIAETKGAALLWAGFWTDPKDPQSRTSKEKLFNFAQMTDHQIVHPATLLGTMIEDLDDLNKCYEGKHERELAMNMWSFVSMCFVMGMQQKEQSSWDFYSDTICF